MALTRSASTTAWRPTSLPALRPIARPPPAKELLDGETPSASSPDQRHKIGNRKVPFRRSTSAARHRQGYATLIPYLKAAIVEQATNQADHLRYISFAPTLYRGGRYIVTCPAQAAIGKNSASTSRSAITISADRAGPAARPGRRHLLLNHIQRRCLLDGVLSSRCRLSRSDRRHPPAKIPNVGIIVASSNPPYHQARRQHRIRPQHADGNPRNAKTAQYGSAPRYVAQRRRLLVKGSIAIMPSAPQFGANCYLAANSSAVQSWGEAGTDIRFRASSVCMHAASKS